MCSKKINEGPVLCSCFLPCICETLYSSVNLTQRERYYIEQFGYYRCRDSVIFSLWIQKVCLPCLKMLNEAVLCTECFYLKMHLNIEDTQSTGVE